MMKRLLDIVLSAFGLVLSSPVLLPVLIAVWLQDFRSPFYIAVRIGQNGKPFRMVKIRSMVVGADQTGVDSTSATDQRITKVGRLVRRYKLDEMTQLWNVLRGNMSLVGPRPNVPREVALYTEAERKLLSVKPGMTDFASIVFADEGEILKEYSDPDLAYHQRVRPWKSRLGLFYVDRRDLRVDMKLVFLTGVAILSRRWALERVFCLLASLGAERALLQIAKRELELVPTPPPGALEVVKNRLL